MNRATEGAYTLSWPATPLIVPRIITARMTSTSRVIWPSGKLGRLPRIIDRGKPGVIGVLADGRRFCNEGLGYHDYVEAPLAATNRGAAARSWLIRDHRFILRYGLGIVRPAPLRWLAECDPATSSAPRRSRGLLWRR